MIGFFWDYSDIEETNYFESQNVNISGCDWSVDLSMIYNKDTYDWEGMIYNFAYDNDGKNTFKKQSVNLTNIDTVTIDITDDVSNSSGNSSSSSSSSSKLNKFAFKSESSIDNNNHEWIYMDNININIMYIVLIIAMIVYIISLKLK